MAAEHRVTVAVPLHRAGAWIESVERSVRALGGSAHVIVSDATGEDDALEVLRGRLAGSADCDFVGPRAIAAGWVAHCNDLLRRAATPYFMWLPQDDAVDRAWVDEGAALLDGDPGAVLAYGEIHAHDGGVLDAVEPIPVEPRFAARDPIERVAAAVAAMATDGRLIGAPFRGVFRREGAPLLPDTGPDGRWADQLWAASLLAHGRFEAIPSGRYWKTWREDATHRAWVPLDSDGDFVEAVDRHVLRALPAAMRDTAARVLWQADHAAQVDRADALRHALVAADEAARVATQRTACVDAELHGARDEIAGLVRVIASYEASRSWRMTAPVRRGAAMVRRARRRFLQRG